MNFISRLLLIFLLVHVSTNLVLASKSFSVSRRVDVFNMGQNGYYCIKIPSLLRTFSGRLLAFGEGRYESCSDTAVTDVVMRYSDDNGLTWSSLRIIHSEKYTVNGNVAIVQDRTNNRILMPFCKNNSNVFLSESDDDGLTWSKPRLIERGSDYGWYWIGTGPPASLQLSSGRIVVPAHHSWIHWGDGVPSAAHVLYSDDGGKSWNISHVIDSWDMASEAQIAEFRDGELIMNMRGALTYRLISKSKDGGITWSSPVQNSDLREPLVGCEGSTVRSTVDNTLYYSGPTSPSVERFNLTLHKSIDRGQSWQLAFIIDKGRSGYSSLVTYPQKHTTIISDKHSNTLGLLYERSNLKGIIFLPTHITFLVINVN